MQDAKKPSVIFFLKKPERERKLKMKSFILFIFTAEGSHVDVEDGGKKNHFLWLEN